LTAVLFLIGTSISLAALKQVGWRPLAQGVLLWVVVALVSLYFIRIALITL
jgi:Kef-type K+ transport system membrane component KefB